MRNSVARIRSSSRCRYGCTAHSPLLLSLHATRPEAAGRNSPKRLCHKALRRRAKWSGVQDSWDVRRDSKPKSRRKVELSTGHDQLRATCFAAVKRALVRPEFSLGIVRTRV